MATWERRGRLYEFRRSLKAPLDALEFAKFAISYNPHGSGRHISVTKGIEESREHQESTCSSTGSVSATGCKGVTIGSVADVYSCGASAFVQTRDVQLDLAKIYLLLSTARKKLGYARDKPADKVGGDRASDGGHSGVGEDSDTADEGRQQCPDLLGDVVRKFERYVVICMALAEKCPLEGAPKQDSHTLETTTLHNQQRKQQHSVANFRLNPIKYRILAGNSETDTDVRIAIADTNQATILSWDFYKDATCTDIFKLLCYALALGNFEVYNVILQNHDKCMLKHVQDNWRVLLSYVPVVCNYKKCRDVIEQVFNNPRRMAENDCINAIDWTMWRSYLILKATQCSYYLLLKFLKTMASIFADVKAHDTSLRSRIDVMLCMVSLVKQYVIYRSFKTSLSMGLKQLEETEYLTFITYIQLNATDKLQLFVDCIELPSGDPGDCECDEMYKDKYHIYTSCLYCETLNGINTLTTFLRLIKIVDGDRSFENQLSPSNPEFSTMLEAVKRCAYVSVNDYMEGIYRKFCGTLNTEAFKLLYVLTQAMILTGFHQKVHIVVLRILYNGDSAYNVLENHFVFKFIVASLEVEDYATGYLTQKKDAETDELVVALQDSYLGKMLMARCPNVQSNSGSLHVSPQYAEFRKCMEQANTKVTFSVAMQAVKCQLSFVEAVLNLLSLVGALPSREHNLHIGMDELTEALGDSGKALLLVQRLLVYLMQHGLSVDNFRNCIYALQDIAAYISGISVNDLHMMFFYTICICSENVQYLESQCSVWLALSSKSAKDVLMFVKASLCSVKATIYRLSTQPHLNFAFSKLIMDISRKLPEDRCELQYLKLPLSRTVMDIHGLLGVYLKIIGMNWEGDILSDGYNALALIGDAHSNAHDEILRELRNLGLLQRVSTVLQSFNCDYEGMHMPKNTLAYGLYNNRSELVEKALSSLVHACAKKNDGLIAACEMYWTLFIFDAVLRTQFSNGTGVQYGADETLKTLRHIKTTAVLMLPREIRNDVEEVIDALIWALQDGHTRGTGEPKSLGNAALSEIATILFGSSYMKSMDFVGLAKLCGQTGRGELPQLASFITEQICGYPKWQDDAFNETQTLNASQITLFEVLTGPDCNSDTEPRKWSDVKVNDLVVRSCILKLLSKVNLAKIEVCQGDKMKISFDKLTHRFTGNTASGLLSKALGKAETGLSSITRKKMQFETLKGKLFTFSKKSAENFNGCFLPVLNFYNTAVLCITDYDLSNVDGSGANDVMKWRSVSQLELLQLLQVDLQLGVMRLLEMCDFTLNTVFVEQLHLVFHNFNVNQCLSVLDTLATHLSRLGWPQSILIHMDAIRKFLNSFCSFPSKTDVYIGRFIASSTYRVALFSDVADYVADNMKEFLHIYVCLDALFSCQDFGPQSPRRSRVGFNMKEVMDALWTDKPIPEEHVEILDPLLMKEYVCVLMKSFEKTFWGSNLMELMQKFKSVEPDFLQIQEQYRDCLLSLQDEYNRKRIHRAEHWLYWRKLVYRFLVIYPEEEASFNRLFKPASMALIRMLEVIHRTTDGVDIVEVDNFEMFKKQLAQKLTLSNYFQVLSAMRHVDMTAAKMLLEAVKAHVSSANRAHYFDAARALYNFDVNSARQW